MTKGFKSSLIPSGKEKSSLLYNDLKKKLSYDVGQNQGSGSGQGSNLVVRKAGSVGGLGTTFHSAKSMRPASASLASKNLYLANQKSGMAGTSLQDRIQIARLKQGGGALAQGTTGQDSWVYGSKNAANESSILNEQSGTTNGGSMQGTQGVGGGLDFYEGKMAGNTNMLEISNSQRVLGAHETPGELNIEEDYESQVI